MDRLSVLPPAAVPPLLDLAKAFNTNVETVIFAGGALLVAAVLFSVVTCLLSFRKDKGDAILLVGLPGAGKTALFCQLRDGDLHNGTVTSMEPNVDRFVLHAEKSKVPNARPVLVVDLPGHPRLRPKLEEYIGRARGIVFLIDGVDFVPHLREATEMLYELLTRREVVQKRIPVLIACNKVDRITAHSMEFVIKQLEKEIDKLRATRTSLSDADVRTSGLTLGKDSEPFKFGQCLNRVTSTASSVLNNKIEDIEGFIREWVKV